MTLFLRLFVAAMIALLAAPVIAAELRPAPEALSEEGEEAAGAVTAESLAVMVGPGSAAYGRSVTTPKVPPSSTVKPS